MLHLIFIKELQSTLNDDGVLQYQKWDWADQVIVRNYFIL